MIAVRVPSLRAVLAQHPDFGIEHLQQQSRQTRSTIGLVDDARQTSASLD